MANSFTGTTWCDLYAEIFGELSAENSKDLKAKLLNQKAVLLNPISIISGSGAAAAATLGTSVTPAADTRDSTLTLDNIKTYMLDPKNKLEFLEAFAPTLHGRILREIDFLSKLLKIHQHDACRLFNQVLRTEEDNILLHAIEHYQMEQTSCLQLLVDLAAINSGGTNTTNSLGRSTSSGSVSGNSARLAKRSSLLADFAKEVFEDLGKDYFKQCVGSIKELITNITTTPALCQELMLSIQSTINNSVSAGVAPPRSTIIPEWQLLVDIQRVLQSDPAGMLNSHYLSLMGLFMDLLFGYAGSFRENLSINEADAILSLLPNLILQGEEAVVIADIELQGFATQGADLSLRAVFVFLQLLFPVVVPTDKEPNEPLIPGSPAASNNSTVVQPPINRNTATTKGQALISAPKNTILIALEERINKDSAGFFNEDAFLGQFLIFTVQGVLLQNANAFARTVLYYDIFNFINKQLLNQNIAYNLGRKNRASREPTTDVLALRNYKGDGGNDHGNANPIMSNSSSNGESVESVGTLLYHARDILFRKSNQVQKKTTVAGTKIPGFDSSGQPLFGTKFAQDGNSMNAMGMGGFNGMGFGMMGGVNGMNPLNTMGMMGVKPVGNPIMGMSPMISINPITGNPMFAQQGVMPGMTMPGMGLGMGMPGMGMTIDPLTGRAVPVPGMGMTGMAGSMVPGMVPGMTPGMGMNGMTPGMGMMNGMIQPTQPDVTTTGQMIPGTCAVLSANGELVDATMVDVNGSGSAGMGVGGGTPYSNAGYMGYANSVYTPVDNPVHSAPCLAGFCLSNETRGGRARLGVLISLINGALSIANWTSVKRWEQAVARKQSVGIGVAANGMNAGMNGVPGSNPVNNAPASGVANNMAGNVPGSSMLGNNSTGNNGDASLLQCLSENWVQMGIVRCVRRVCQLDPSQSSEFLDLIIHITDSFTMQANRGGYAGRSEIIENQTGAVGNQPGPITGLVSGASSIGNQSAIMSNLMYSEVLLLLGEVLSRGSYTVTEKIMARLNSHPNQWFNLTFILELFLSFSNNMGNPNLIAKHNSAVNFIANVGGVATVGNAGIPSSNTTNTNNMRGNTMALNNLPSNMGAIVNVDSTIDDSDLFFSKSELKIENPRQENREGIQNTLMSVNSKRMKELAKNINSKHPDVVLINIVVRLSGGYVRPLMLVALVKLVGGFYSNKLACSNILANKPLTNKSISKQKLKNLRSQNSVTFSNFLLLDSIERSFSHCLVIPKTLSLPFSNNPLIGGSSIIGSNGIGRMGMNALSGMVGGNTMNASKNAVLSANSGVKGSPPNAVGPAAGTPSDQRTNTNAVNNMNTMQNTAINAKGGFPQLSSNNLAINGYNQKVILVYRILEIFSSTSNFETPCLSALSNMLDPKLPHLTAEIFNSVASMLPDIENKYYIETKHFYSGIQGDHTATGGVAGVNNNVAGVAGNMGTGAGMGLMNTAAANVVPTFNNPMPGIPGTAGSANLGAGNAGGGNIGASNVNAGTPDSLNSLILAVELMNFLVSSAQLMPLRRRFKDLRILEVTRFVVDVIFNKFIPSIVPDEPTKGGIINTGLKTDVELAEETENRTNAETASARLPGVPDLTGSTNTLLDQQRAISNTLILMGGSNVSNLYWRLSSLCLKWIKIVLKGPLIERNDPLETLAICATEPYVDNVVFPPKNVNNKVNNAIGNDLMSIGNTTGNTNMIGPTVGQTMGQNTQNAQQMQQQGGSGQLTAQQLQQLQQNKTIAGGTTFLFRAFLSCPAQQNQTFRMLMKLTNLHGMGHSGSTLSSVKKLVVGTGLDILRILFQRDQLFLSVNTATFGESMKVGITSNIYCSVHELLLSEYPGKLPTSASGLNIAGEFNSTVNIAGGSLSSILGGDTNDQAQHMFVPRTTNSKTVDSRRRAQVMRQNNLSNLSSISALAATSAVSTPSALLLANSSHFGGLGTKKNVKSFQPSNLMLLLYYIDSEVGSTQQLRKDECYNEISKKTLFLLQQFAKRSPAVLEKTLSLDPNLARSVSNGLTNSMIQMNTKRGQNIGLFFADGAIDPDTLQESFLYEVRENIYCNSNGSTNVLFSAGNIASVIAGQSTQNACLVDPSNGMVGVDGLAGNTTSTGLVGMLGNNGATTSNALSGGSFSGIHIDVMSLIMTDGTSLLLQPFSALTQCTLMSEHEDAIAKLEDSIVESTDIATIKLIDFYNTNAGSLGSLHSCLGVGGGLGSYGSSSCYMTTEQSEWARMGYLREIFSVDTRSFGFRTKHDLFVSELLQEQFYLVNSLEEAIGVEDQYSEELQEIINSSTRSNRLLVGLQPAVLDRLSGREMALGLLLGLLRENDKKNSNNSRGVIKTTSETNSSILCNIYGTELSANRAGVDSLVGKINNAGDGLQSFAKAAGNTDGSGKSSKKDRPVDPKAEWTRLPSAGLCVSDTMNRLLITFLGLANLPHGVDFNPRSRVISSFAYLYSMADNYPSDHLGTLVSKYYRSSSSSTTFGSNLTSYSDLHIEKQHIEYSYILEIISLLLKTDVFKDVALRSMATMFKSRFRILDAFLKGESVTGGGFRGDSNTVVPSANASSIGIDSVMSQNNVLTAPVWMRPSLYKEYSLIMRLISMELKEINNLVKYYNNINLKNLSSSYVDVASRQREEFARQQFLILQDEIRVRYFHMAENLNTAANNLYLPSAFTTLLETFTKSWDCVEEKFSGELAKQALENTKQGISDNCWPNLDPNSQLSSKNATTELPIDLATYLKPAIGGSVERSTNADDTYYNPKSFLYLAGCLLLQTYQDVNNKDAASDTTLLNQPMSITAGVRSPPMGGMTPTASGNMSSMNNPNMSINTMSATASAVGDSMGNAGMSATMMSQNLNSGIMNSMNSVAAIGTPVNNNRMAAANNNTLAITSVVANRISFLPQTGVNVNIFYNANIELPGTICATPEDVGYLDHRVIAVLRTLQRRNINLYRSRMWNEICRNLSEFLEMYLVYLESNPLTKSATDDVFLSTLRLHIEIPITSITKKLDMFILPAGRYISVGSNTLDPSHIPSQEVSAKYFYLFFRYLLRCADVKNIDTDRKSSIPKSFLKQCYLFVLQRIGSGYAECLSEKTKICLYSCILESVECFLSCICNGGVEIEPVIHNHDFLIRVMRDISSKNANLSLGALTLLTSILKNSLKTSEVAKEALKGGNSSGSDPSNGLQVQSSINILSSLVSGQHFWKVMEDVINSIVDLNSRILSDSNSILASTILKTFSELFELFALTEELPNSTAHSGFGSYSSSSDQTSVGYGFLGNNIGFGFLVNFVERGLLQRFLTVVPRSSVEKLPMFSDMGRNFGNAEGSLRASKARRTGADDDVVMARSSSSSSSKSKESAPKKLSNIELTKIKTVYEILNRLLSSENGMIVSEIETWCMSGKEIISVLEMCKEQFKETTMDTSGKKRSSETPELILSAALAVVNVVATLVIAKSPASANVGSFLESGHNNAGGMSSGVDLSMQGFSGPEDQGLSTIGIFMIQKGDAFLDCLTTLVKHSLENTNTQKELQTKEIQSTREIVMYSLLSLFRNEPELSLLIGGPSSSLADRIRQEQMKTRERQRQEEQNKKADNNVVKSLGSQVSSLFSSLVGGGGNGNETDRNQNTTTMVGMSNSMTGRMGTFSSSSTNSLMSPDVAYEFLIVRVEKMIEVFDCMMTIDGSQQQMGLSNIGNNIPPPIDVDILEQVGHLLLIYLTLFTLVTNVNTNNQAGSQSQGAQNTRMPYGTNGTMMPGSIIMSSENTLLPQQNLIPLDKETLTNSGGPLGSLNLIGNGGKLKNSLLKLKKNPRGPFLQVLVSEMGI